MVELYNLMENRAHREHTRIQKEMSEKLFESRGLFTVLPGTRTWADSLKMNDVRTVAIQTV